MILVTNLVPKGKALGTRLSCNYSARLVLTNLSSFFAYLTLMYSLLYDTLYMK